eukprot:s1175_g5.t1
MFPDSMDQVWLPVFRIVRPSLPEGELTGVTGHAMSIGNSSSKHETLRHHVPISPIICRRRSLLCASTAAVRLNFCKVTGTSDQVTGAWENPLQMAFLDPQC